MLTDQELIEIRLKLMHWGEWLRESGFTQGRDNYRVGYSKPHRINLLRKKLITANGKEKRKYKKKTPARDSDAEKIDLAVCKLGSKLQAILKSKYFYQVRNRQAAHYHRISVSTYKRAIQIAQHKIHHEIKA